MIAARFRLIAWVAGCAMAALLCYMASQSVAAERGALARVDGEIADTQNDIRRLQTEIAARSRMGQLERWNQVLALQAARPVQYVANEVQLASLAGHARLPLDPAIVASHGAVQTVAYQPAPPAAQPAPQPEPIAQAPMLRQATYVRPKASRLNDSGDAVPVLRAALEKPAAVPRAIVSRPATLKLAAFEMPVASRKAMSGAEPVKRKPARHHDGLLPADLRSLIAAEKSASTKADR